MSHAFHFSIGEGASLQLKQGEATTTFPFEDEYVSSGPHPIIQYVAFLENGLNKMKIMMSYEQGQIFDPVTGGIKQDRNSYTENQLKFLQDFLQEYIHTFFT